MSIWLEELTQGLELSSLKNNRQPDRYDEACWDTLSFILNSLNTYDSKDIPKSVLYRDISQLRPSVIRKSNGK